MMVPMLVLTSQAATLMVNHNSKKLYVIIFHLFTILLMTLAGDHVKFGLPFAHSMIFLAW